MEKDELFNILLKVSELNMSIENAEKKIIKLFANEKEFNDYITNVRKQLDCNASDEYKYNFITYDYTEESVNNNLDYFKKCMNAYLSPYKSLLFFGDYLENHDNINFLINETKSSNNFKQLTYNKI